MKTRRSLLGLTLTQKLGALALLAGLLWYSGSVGTRAAAASSTDAAVPAATAPAGSADLAVSSGSTDASLATAAVEEAGAGEGGDHEEEHPSPADFFLVLIAVLIFAKVFGEGAERIGQPAVLGELIAGVILGGSVLGIVPSTGLIYEIIHYMAEVGVAILLFEIGLETDIKEMFKVGASSAIVAIVGVSLPFALGWGYWMWAEPSIGVRPEGISLSMVAIFVGATLTATSVGITARVLSDLKLMHRSESRIIIGAAVIDDVMGLVILGVVSGLAAGGGLSALGVATDFAVAIGFLVLAVVVGNLVAPRLFSIIDRMRVRGILLVSAFAFALLIAAVADKVGSALIIGSFAAGIVLSSVNQFDLIVERIEPVADIFTPIFFVSVGAVVNVQLFIPGTDSFNPDVLVVGGALVLVAFIGKLAAGYSVGWGKEKLNHAAIGIGMVPRGEVGLIFAALGRSAGLLSDEVYSAILIMVIVTTFIAPPLLKIFFTPNDEDRGQPQPAHGHGH